MPYLSRALLPALLGLCLLPAAFRPASSFAAAPPQKIAGYHEVARFAVGGDGGWDYVTFDAPNNRLFITRGSHVMVVDAKTGKALGDISGVSGCHGVALAPDLNKGFISSGGNNSVVVFDLKTLKTIGKTAVGKNPDAIMYDAGTHRVFTFNGQSADTTVMDAETSKVVGTLPLGGKPEFAVLDLGKVWVNVEDTSEIACFDPKTIQVTRRIKLAPGEEPSGLAVDTKKHRLFSVCSNQKCVIVDEATGKIIATPLIGNGPDAASWDGTSAFASNGEDGTLTVLHETPSGWAGDTVATARGARTMTIDPKTHRVFLVTAKFETAVSNAAAPANGRPPRPKMIPGTFMVLVFGPQ